MNPRVVDYREHPIYIDVPFREIRPTRPADRRLYGREWEGGRSTLSPDEWQMYRVAIMRDGSTLVGEGSGLLHMDLIDIVARTGASRVADPSDPGYRSMETWKAIEDDIRLRGRAFYLPTHIRIELQVWDLGFENGKFVRYASQEEREVEGPKRLPPWWDELVRGIELKLVWTP